MKILKIMAGTFAGFLVLFVLVGLLLPARYNVERSLLIKAPVHTIFELVDNLELNEKWSPWKANDPTMTFTYGEIKQGLGASYKWTSKHSGAGKLTVIESSPDALIRTELDFRGQGKAEESWKFQASAQGTIVTQGFSGNSGYNLFARYFALLMDRFVGQYLEKGLKNLKQLAETADRGMPQPDDQAE